MSFMMIHFTCNIAIYVVDTTLYSKYDQVSDLWEQLELASELESDLEIAGTSCSFLITIMQTFNFFCLTSLKSIWILKCKSLFLKEKRSWGDFSVLK